jgi:CRP/FNR family transcriptional regulator
MVPADRLRALGEVATLHRFRKGEALFIEGQPAETVWLIKRGWVYLVKRTPQGAPVTIFTVTPEEVLCGFSAVSGQRAYYASAIAATDTTAIRVPRSAFSDVLKSEPEFAVAVLAIYHTRMRHMADAISLAPAPVEQRLAHTLLRLKASFGKVIPVTHKELARMAGTRLETSIRAVARMKRQGWLRSSRGQITILAPDPLKALLREQNHR